MSWADAVNGSFEVLGGLFILLSILRLHRDKVVRGVSWVHVAFFAFWGYWNLYFYPSLDQWLSFWGGVAVVTANTLWLVQMLYYTARERRLARTPGEHMILLEDKRQPEPEDRDMK